MSHTWRKTTSSATTRTRVRRPSGIIAPVQREPFLVGSKSSSDFHTMNLLEFFQQDKFEDLAQSSDMFKDTHYFGHTAHCHEHDHHLHPHSHQQELQPVLNVADDTSPPPSSSQHRHQQNQRRGSIQRRGSVNNNNEDDNSYNTWYSFMPTDFFFAGQRRNSSSSSSSLSSSATREGQQSTGTRKRSRDQVEDSLDQQFRLIVKRTKVEDDEGLKRSSSPISLPDIPPPVATGTSSLFANNNHTQQINNRRSSISRDNYYDSNGNNNNENTNYMNTRRRSSSSATEQPIPLPYNGYRSFSGTSSSTTAQPLPTCATGAPDQTYAASSSSSLPSSPDQYPPHQIQSARAHFRDALKFMGYTFTKIDKYERVLLPDDHRVSIMIRETQLLHTNIRLPNYVKDMIREYKLMKLQASINNDDITDMDVDVT